MKVSSLFFVLFLFSILSCSGTGSDPIQIDPVEPLNFIEITQFVDSVSAFSSEYHESPGSWSSSKLLGSPDTYPKYGVISPLLGHQTDPITNVNF